MGTAGRGHPVHLVTQARKPMSEDIAYRQRRYLIMMAIRAVCFIAAVLMFINHLGWLAAFPVVVAIFIPYIAVVFANGGREPNSDRGFMEYRPRVPAMREDRASRQSGVQPDGPGSPAGPPAGSPGAPDRPVAEGNGRPGTDGSGWSDADEPGRPRPPGPDGR